MLSKTVQFSVAQDQSIDSDTLIENSKSYQKERKLFIDALIKSRGEGEIKMPNAAILNSRLTFLVILHTSPNSP